MHTFIGETRYSTGRPTRLHDQKLEDYLLGIIIDVIKFRSFSYKSDSVKEKQSLPVAISSRDLPNEIPQSHRFLEEFLEV